MPAPQPTHGAVESCLFKGRTECGLPHDSTISPSCCLTDSTIIPSRSTSVAPYASKQE